MAAGNRSLFKRVKHWTPEELAARLQDALGPSLKSVLLFGSAATGDFVEGVSDYDVLIVADSLGVDTLRKLSEPLRKWCESGHPTPQLFTPEELQRSADAFPIEFLDMQQARKVLFGEDPLASISVAEDHLRLELERELKGKLLLLRRKSLMVIDRPAELEALLEASVATFLVLGRAALRLFQPTIPPQKTAALRELARRLSLEVGPILEWAEIREGKQHAPRGEAEVLTLFRAYLDTLEKLVAAIDAFLHSPHPSGEKK